MPSPETKAEPGLVTELTLLASAIEACRKVARYAEPEDRLGLITAAALLRCEWIELRFADEQQPTREDAASVQRSVSRRLLERAASSGA